MVISAGGFRSRSSSLVRSALALAMALAALALTAGERAAAQDKLVTVEDIKRIAPKADDTFAQAIADAEPELRASGITTRLRMAHFLTQVMTETGGLHRLDENLNYSFKTLMRVFSRRVVSEAKAREIAGNPQAVGNWVYRNRLGNGDWNSGDGWTFRGSGYIQLTGRENFRTRGRETGLPLEEQPDLARQAREGLMAAIAYWKARAINDAADDNDKRRVRILVNGPAAHGFAQSQVWFDRAWTRVFQAKSGFEAGEAPGVGETLDTQAAFDAILEESGLLSSDFEAGGDPAAERAAAIRQFQGEVGLPETGVLDEATQDALLDPREWRHLDASDAAPARPEADLEQTVSFRMTSGAAPAGEEAAAAPSLEPSAGSGETVADPAIDQGELAALSEATAIYPDYEIRAAGQTRETFKPFAVIGEDTRTAVLDTTAFPARAIVQILFETREGDQHLCTGAMISDDTVLTAAHCIHSGTAAGEPYQNFRVTPGRNVGAAPFGLCRAGQVFVLSGWTQALTVEESRNYDLGAIKLDCHVGEQTGWFGVRSLGDEEVGLKTTVEAYAADLAPTGRQWVSDDEIRALWEFKGFYQNDTYGGTSGAPVFATGSSDTIIGVHTNGASGDEEPWASNNAFTRITPQRLALVQEWTER